MRRIETSIDIDAPPRVVWDVLTDFAAYSEWNPFMTVEGEPREGERLAVRLTPPGARATTFRPTVLVADGSELRWRGDLLVPGLYDGEHSFALERRDDGTTRLRHDEVFSGVLVGLINRRVGPAVERGFWAMNAALKERVEGARLTPDDGVRNSTR
ncbi:SRPBCC domain-containing protein [Halomarina litorea]|uniref:SRPBCC domain-containing protein n=1 Tax=Halomarina litorea TaxID=2961595 RepID=UPI0020C4766B|nr:SRPBCC domain-containing protein [Halomarina sp. BCD28]